MNNFKMENKNSASNKQKLLTHHKSYSKEDLLICYKDLGFNIEDIIEIYHPDEDENQPRLLLQILPFDEDLNVQKDTISIETNIAGSFQLRGYKDVIVNKIDPKSVVLDLLGLTFRDQYLGRSDMWRLKTRLVNTVVYLNKKIEFCCSLIRCQVYEMWAQGERVACGVVSEDTKIVFRSSTCQAYLFIQMSSEMWEFDMYGDLYFEKAVNGFLAELFTKWKKEGSNHDVTIVLFSRSFYKASCIEEFPISMRECLQVDYQGRFYEDFYRVAVQSERFDDWTSILSHLRFLFHNYLDDVLDHHSSSEHHIPEAYNSSASQGNFLEVFNISLNVFEKHYLDRSFDRTGQMSVVITPGVGVFEVDRELTNITQQRITDNGVGSDLVCVGEQPLHAVPLFKFHKKRGTLKTEYYSMPHTWINLSFYSSNKRVIGAATFIPRIKVPQEILKMVNSEQAKFSALSNMKPLADDTLPNAKFDYNAYDAQVFKVPNNQNNRTYKSLQRAPARKKTASHSSVQPQLKVNYSRKNSDPDLFRSSEVMNSNLNLETSSVSSLLGRSPAINIPFRLTERKLCSQSFGALNIEGGIAERRMSANFDSEDLSSSYASKIGSSGASSPSDIQTLLGKLPVRIGRSLINPFNPSTGTIKLTSNRRRWIHTFPKGPTGNLIQPHHYQVSAANLSDEEELLERLMDGDKKHGTKKDSSNGKDSAIDEPATSVPIHRSCARQASAIDVLPRGTSPQKSASSTDSFLLLGDGLSPYGGTPNGGSCILSQRHHRLLWGATGEQKWNAEITTGVDWKSLSLPACLPLTTDYFPDESSLNNDYEVAAYYSRVPEAVTDIFLELVSQRLMQGFQLIMLPEDTMTLGTYRNKYSFMRSRSLKQEDDIKECKLSIGRVFHHVQWTDSSSINVTIYRPKHPYAQIERHYKYLFRSPYLSRYEVSSAEFRTERLEDFKWNYLDNYVCFKGDPRDCMLLDEFKYWTFRLALVPDVFRTETRRLMDVNNNSPCDTYHSLTLDEQQSTIDNFLRFFEMLNRIKRPAAKKCRGPGDARERLGSNRMVDRSKQRSGNRMRYESDNKDESSVRSNENDEIPKEEGEIRVNRAMTYLDVVAVMRDPIQGISCITPHKGLPVYTFVSADATAWVFKHMEDVNTEAAAVDYLQQLLDEKFISHLSKARLKKFVHGFYFYYFVTGNEKTDQILFDLTALEREWHEVEIEPCNTTKRSSSTVSPNQCPSFLLPELPRAKNNWTAHEKPNVSNKGLYHDGYIEIDVGRKSDRQEWGHLKYQTKYCPLQCFELEVQWMCATGNVVLDLIATWQRRAINHNLHLFPIPSYPFALSLSTYSNPLRGPIVIPLKMDALRDNNCEVFSNFPQSSRLARVRLFQESILRKFGFISYPREDDQDVPCHFVHVTGNIIVLAGNTAAAITKIRQKSKDKKNKTASAGTVFAESVNPLCPDPCFFWTFNYMLTKRWKSVISGDEALSERILVDFKDFCNNSNHRLRDYWDSFLVAFMEPPLSPTSYGGDVFIL